jgi:hypothetical protein
VAASAAAAVAASVATKSIFSRLFQGRGSNASSFFCANFPAYLKYKYLGAEEFFGGSGFTALDRGAEGI